MKFTDKVKTLDLPINYERATRQTRAMARAQYIEQQDGRCYFCKEDIYKPPRKNYGINRSRFPRGFFEHPIHLHHDHGTGLTLGAVHAYCNAVLWQIYGE